MTEWVKQAGAWKPVKKLWVKQGGVWKPVRRAFVKQGGIWKQYFQDEVVATLTAANSIVLRDYFTTAEWQNPLIRKRVVIPAGVQIGGSNFDYAIAVTHGDSQANAWYGDLVIDIYGAVRGRGGVPNSGGGGHAIWGIFLGAQGQKSIVNVHPGGALQGGGGAGGVGGQGGPGVWYSGRNYTFQEGPLFQQDVYQFLSQNGSTGVVYWGGNISGSEVPNGWSSGGWQYWKGASQGAYWHAIYRTQTRTAYDVPNYTSGGPGGSGGRGAGSDGGNAGGQPGGGGGTNAGSGGYGGTGGGLGANGGGGATGNSGNNGGGSGGGSGGLAGGYLRSGGNIILNNLGGTISGRLL